MHYPVKEFHICHIPGQFLLFLLELDKIRILNAISDYKKYKILSLMNVEKNNSLKYFIATIVYIF